MEKQGEWNDFQYEVLKTADGSPTIRLWKNEQSPECMHHLGGALTESLYIYGEALDWAFERTSPTHVLSVGLGLGYNELIATCRYLNLQRSPEDFYLESFEIETSLRENFLNWLQGQSLPQPWQQVYDDILNSVTLHFKILPGFAKETLLGLIQQNRWQLRTELNERTEFSERFHCILFDAFSKGATPNLWNEDFLKEFLQKAAARKSVLSTYAATGSLKRALYAENFEVDLRQGFAGKRQSTWATRQLS